MVQDTHCLLKLENEARSQQLKKNNVGLLTLEIQYSKKGTIFCSIYKVLKNWEMEQTIVLILIFYLT